jgi:hypothetical protein
MDMETWKHNRIYHRKIPRKGTEKAFELFQSRDL